MSRKSLLPVVALVVALAVGCSKSDAGSAGANADVSPYVGGNGASSGGAAQPSSDEPDAGGAPKAVAAVDPCALLTTDEIVRELEAAQEPNQLAAFKAQGGTWRVAPSAEQQGISKVCNYKYTGTISSGDVRMRSEFTLSVTDGAFVNPNVNGAKDRPIPGLGDEAYYMSRGPMMPYARVGKVAIGLEGFPSTPKSKAGVDLLRNAVARLR